MELFFVKMVDHCVSHQNVCIVGIIVEVDVRLVESHPDGNPVCESGHDLFGVIEKGFRERRGIELQM